MPINDAIVNAIILQQFGEPPAAVQSIEMGVMTFKYKVKVKGNFYILRIYPPSNITRTDLEFQIMDHLFNRGCKVPQPVQYYNGDGIHWLLYKFIEGQPLSEQLHTFTDLETAALAKDVTTNLLHFADEPVEGFGFLLIGEGTFHTWKDFLQESIRRGEAYLEAIKEFDRPTIDLLLSFAQQQLNKMEVKKPCLVWSDFSQGNIIIHDKKLAGFVDFEGCVSGDPLMALGYLFAIEGHSLFFNLVEQEFKKRFTVNVEIIVFYTIIRLFRLSKYFNLAFPTGINRDPLLLYFKGVPAAVAYIKAL